MTLASTFPELDAAIASRMLQQAGFAVSPENLRVELRYGRWAVTLPSDRLAWFPADSDGRKRLVQERNVLRLLAQRCSFRVPHILYESDTGFDVRALVVGRCEPERLFEEARADAGLSRQIGRALGAILAEQYTRIAPADVAGWLTERMIWPAEGGWILERLPKVIDDAMLIDEIGRLLARYEAVPVEAGDCVLVHGDVGFHNIVVDERANVIGIFDYDSAAWADRHHDFRYLVFDSGREELLQAALAVYEPATGRTLDRDRIKLYNAACAVSYLAYRHGIPANRKWCGRTLAEDLHWVRDALSALR